MAAFLPLDADVMAPLPGEKLNSYLPGRCSEEDCELLWLSRTHAKLDGLRGSMRLTFVGYRKPGPTWPTRHLAEVYRVDNAQAYYAINRRAWRFCPGPVRWLLVTDVTDSPAAPYKNMKSISVEFDNRINAPPNDGQGACDSRWYQAN